MRHFEFYNLVYDHYVLYIILLIVFIVFFILIGKNYTHTWFDPLRIYLLTAAFTAVVPVFLYATGTINLNLAAYFTLAQVFFWLAFIIPAKKKLILSKKTLTDEKRIASILYIIFFSIYIISVGLTYLLLGIPVFNESRLDTYTGSGLGVLGRMIPFCQIYCIFYSFYLWKNSNGFFNVKRIITILSFCLFAVVGILSGSRSSFYIFLFIYWGYCYFYSRDVKKISRYYKFFIIGIVISLFSFSLKSGTYDLFGSLSSFGLRAISSGDNYYMALPNDIWKQVETGPWFTHLFYGLLGPLKLIDGSNIPPPIGFQLTWLVNPSIYGLSTGPLSSPALLGFLYFGWWGIIFSIAMGLFVSLVIFRMPASFPKGMISAILSTYIYIQMLSFIGDPALGMGYLFDILFNVFVLVLLILLINRLSRGSGQETQV